MNEQLDNTMESTPHPTPPPAGGQQNGDDAVDAVQSVDTVPLYRKGRIVIPVLVVLTAVVIAGWYWYIGMRDFVSTDDAFVDGNRATVSAKMLGRIATLAVAEGDTVHAGSVLVTIDDTDLRAQEAQARSALVLAEQNARLTEIGMERAKEDFNRVNAQYAQRIVPREQFEHAQKEFDAARARHAVSLAQISAARAQIGVVDAQLRNTTISSSIDGVVSKRWVLPGDVVQPGQPIYSIYDRTTVWVTANLEETSLTHIRVGDTVEISVDAYPDIAFAGRVFQIGANTASQFSLIPPNNASGNFTKITQRVPVKISVSDPSGGRPHPLLPGMSVEVKVKIR